MFIGDRKFERDHTHIMGILNVTPDSFFDGGSYSDKDSALKRAEIIYKEGASIIDVGGESTRPGFTPISAKEEIERVCPVIEAIKENFDIAISLDTYKAEVAKAGIDAGADLINDIWGLKKDPEMAALIASKGASVCISHNRENANYQSFIQDLVGDLGYSLNLARKAGIADDRIMIDPGVGFAKTYEQNLLAIKNVDALNVLGYPILLGVSRKSVIGNALDLPSDERLEGTLATTALAVLKHIEFVRVHDVKENKRVIDMIEAINNA